MSYMSNMSIGVWVALLVAVAWVKRQHWRRRARERTCTECFCMTLKCWELLHDQYPATLIILTMHSSSPFPHWASTLIRLSSPFCMCIPSLTSVSVTLPHTPHGLDAVTPCHSSEPVVLPEPGYKWVDGGPLAVAMVTLQTKPRQLASSPSQWRDHSVSMAPPPPPAVASCVPRQPREGWGG